MPPGQFALETDELCSGRRLASCLSCMLRPIIISGRRVHPANDHTRNRQSRCPSPASSRPCTSRAASYGMSRAIADGGSSFGTAASCICRVVGFIISQMQAEDGGNYTIEQQSSGKRCNSSRCTVRNSPVRPIALGTDELCSSWRLASRHGCCARLLSPSAVCTLQMITQRFNHLTAPNRTEVAPAPCPRLHTVCHGTFPAAKAALGLQPASCICRVVG